MAENPQVKLHGVGKTVGTIEVVGGPHPYLWIGDAEGRVLGVTGSTDELRELRDYITKALRRAVRASDDPEVRS